MSGNIYEFQPEITRSHIEAGVRRARELRSRYFSNAFSGAFGKGVKAISGWFRRRNQTRRLQDLPDYLLNDMGIERYQIEDVISGALSRDSLSLSPTGRTSSRPAFWRGKSEADEQNKLAA